MSRYFVQMRGGRIVKLKDFLEARGRGSDYDMVKHRIRRRKIEGFDSVCYTLHYKSELLMPPRAEVNTIAPPDTVIVEDFIEMAAGGKTVEFGHLIDAIEMKLCAEGRCMVRGLGLFTVVTAKWNRSVVKAKIEFCACREFMEKIKA